MTAHRFPPIFSSHRHTQRIEQTNEKQFRHTFSPDSYICIMTTEVRRNITTIDFSLKSIEVKTKHMTLLISHRDLYTSKKRQLSLNSKYELTVSPNFIKEDYSYDTSFNRTSLHYIEGVPQQYMQTKSRIALTDHSDHLEFFGEVIDIFRCTERISINFIPHSRNRNSIPIGITVGPSSVIDTPPVPRPAPHQNARHRLHLAPATMARRRHSCPPPKSHLSNCPCCPSPLDR